MKIRRLLVLLFASTAILLTACTKEKEENVPNILGIPNILGTWVDDDGSGVVVSWTFNSNKTGNERLVVSYNGVTISDKTMNFTYSQRSNYVDFKNDKKEWTYDVTVTGNHMRLGNAEDGYFELTKQ
jgi:hypothetical protein